LVYNTIYLFSKFLKEDLRKFDWKDTIQFRSKKN
jgi:hypothetical protein